MAQHETVTSPHDMWITLLLMAVAVSLEPFRIGMTLLMINRPRPMLQLVAFLTGGFTMGIVVGVVVLFVLRPALGSAHFTLPRMQLAVGAVLVAYAVLVALSARRAKTADDDGLVARLVARFRPLATRAWELINNSSLWTAGFAGLLMALPSVDYLAVLAIIAASKAAVAAQFGALVVFNAVAFSFVEIPLCCYLVAPDRTRATLVAVHDWLRSRRHRDVAILLAVVGCLLLIAGFSGI
jgi:hypothetical protein